MNTEKDKDINASFAVRTVKNVINIYTTLSDRLKQAGIKENKPPKPCTGKGCKHKAHQRNKKTQISKACVSSNFQKTKKFRKPLKHYAVPYSDKSVQNDPVETEIPTKHAETTPETVAENDENKEKETIFVSLDFIEDCQNYKKKVRKPKDHNTRRGLRSDATTQKQGSDTRGSSRISSTDSAEVSPVEDKSGESGDPSEEHVNGGTTENQKPRSGIETNFSEVLQRVQPLLNNFSREDIAKIDKKYLDSILNFATKIEAKKKELVDEVEEKMIETHSETKKKLTGKDFFELKQKTKEEVPRKDSNSTMRGCELKLKTKEHQEEVSIKYSNSTIGDAETEWKDATCTEARIVRDSTKSEEQIQLKKGKNLFDSYNNSKMKTKNVTHSKPDINDARRKKRKPRNKIVKNNAKEFIETSLPSEVSRVADVKELWRRKTLLKKSENSLTSHSSCTVPETDEYPLSKNLESYKILKSLVEEEIKNITKKSENKNNTGEVRTKENNPKHSELAKKPPLGRKANEMPLLKKRLLLAEGKLEKSELLSFLGEDVPKEANPKLVSVEEKAKNAKIPSKIIENWSILNRLEQAFVGLGTPTFPDKSIKSNLIKPKQLGNNEASLTTTENLLKETKKVQKYREVLLKKENKASTVQRNPARAVKKNESAAKLNVLSKEETPIKPKKPVRKDIANVPERNPSKVDKTCPKLKKKKPQNPPEMSPSGKLSLEQIAQDLGKGVTEEPLTPSKTRLFIKSKYQKMAKKKVITQKKLSAESLERKRTFDVIPGIDESISQPRRSKSCGINDTNLDGRYSATKTQEPNVFSKEGQKIRSRSIENDGVTRIISNIPKRLAKNPNKPATTCEQPSKVGGNLKSLGEEECLKGNQKTFQGRSPINQKEDVKNERATEELPKDTPPGKKMNLDNTERDKRSSDNDENKNGSEYDGNKKNIEYDENKKGTEEEEDSNNSSPVTERAVKKRSILSVNQHCDQSTVKLMQIKEKEASTSSLENGYKEKESKTSYSNTSISSTGIKDPGNVNLNRAKNKIASCKQKRFIPVLEDNDKQEEDMGEWRTRRQALWEQDMTHYRSIVREIMSQYKRIDGFLKQNEQLRNFANDSPSFYPVTCDDSKSGPDSQIMNIHEYRKKIITEYKEMPIFEYKSKMEQNKDGCFIDTVRKRNLLVVKDYKGTDDDVKDYQPRIQKVLDSQLYVDKDRQIKRSETHEKISSMQDTELRKKEGKTTGEEWQRSMSTPRTFQPQRSYVILSSAQTFVSQDSSIDNVTSESTTCYGQDTESCQEVSG